MNIEQLQYICAVSQHKSITQAAESLYVTQQTISKAIGRLEKELGFQLLVRNYNGIMLTDTGKLFAEKSQTILDQIQELYYIDSPHRATTSFSGTIPVYCSNYFIYRVAPKLLVYFSEHYPNVKLQFKEHLVKDIVNLLLEESCLGFITTLSNKTGSIIAENTLHDLEKYEMSKDEILVLLSKNHPLAQNAKINIKNLEKYPIIIDNLPGIETIFSEEYETKLSVLMYSSNLAPNIDTIRRNTTLGFITKSILANYALPKDVVALPLLPKCEATSYFIHAKNHQLSELEREIIRHSSRILANF